MNEEKGKESLWICGACQEKLKLGKVKVAYLGGNFEVELMHCPTCGQVLIEEDLAVGKMLEIEKGLEDK